MTDDPKLAVGEAGARLRALVAAEHADWQQVVLNGGPPCFHYEGNRGRFCMRAERWAGHDADHPFVSLARLLDALLSVPVVSPHDYHCQVSAKARGELSEATCTCGLAYALERIARKPRGQMPRPVAPVVTQEGE